MADDACEICGAMPEHFLVPSHTPERVVSKRTRIMHDWYAHNIPRAPKPAPDRRRVASGERE